MGFLASADTVTITAKLTPFGRQQLLTNSSSIITHFGLGDSDANYNGSLPLGNGEVPGLTGEIGTDNLFSNGVYNGVKIKSTILVNAFGDRIKPIQSGSAQVLITPKLFGLTGVTGNESTQYLIDRTDNDSLTNLFKSFGLPITQEEKALYSSTISPVGFLDTAIKGLNQDKIIVIPIDKCSYGETLDGKAIKVTLSPSGGTLYEMYSTFQKSLKPLTTLDTQIRETTQFGSTIGNNVAFLFSDKIQRPNGGESARSWATGFNMIKPFSLNNKERFNPTSVPSTGTNLDKAVGIAYLDKGFIVVTEPLIVNQFNPISGGTYNIEYNHLSNQVAQNITCIVERDEFSTSQNSTYSDGDTIRLSEVALYDDFNNVIAYAKSNEHINIGSNQYLALGIRILV